MGYKYLTFQAFIRELIAHKKDLSNLNLIRYAYVDFIECKRMRSEPVSHYESLDEIWQTYTPKQLEKDLQSWRKETKRLQKAGLIDLASASPISKTKPKTLKKVIPFRFVSQSTKAETTASSTC